MSNQLQKLPNPKVFFDVSIDGVPQERMVFEIYARSPAIQAALNFISICREYREDLDEPMGHSFCRVKPKETCCGVSHHHHHDHETKNKVIDEDDDPFEFFSSKPLKYSGVKIHRVVHGEFFQCGKGMNTIFGLPILRDSNHISRRHVRGSLAICPKGNGSEFYVCFKSLPWLDGSADVIGRLVSGDHTLDMIGNSNPEVQEIVITHSDQIGWELSEAINLQFTPEDIMPYHDTEQDIEADEEYARRKASAK